MIELLFVLTVQQPAHAAPIGQWLKGFCERHLIAEHPYQVWVRKLSTPELAKEYRLQAALHRWHRGNEDEYEIALNVISERYQVEPDQQMLEAMEDYPDVRILYLLQPSH